MAAQHSTLLLPSDLSAALLVASLCVGARRRWRAPALLVGAYALFMLAAGAIIAERLAPEYAGDSMLTRVRIAEPPVARDRTVTFFATPVADARIPPRVRVRWYEPPWLPAVGEVWELELRLQAPRGTFNPGTFDYETWLFREKIQATGYVANGKRNRLLWSGTTGWRDRLRENFVWHAEAAAATSESAAVLSAIGVGLRHRVTREQWDRFAVSGTSHLMAISGLHVGLAAMAVFLAAFIVLGAFPLRNVYVLAMLCGTAAALLYALVSGFGVPARRAVIMLLVVAVAMLRRRVVDPPAALALAAVLVFVSDPVATLTPGFQLSFAAVIVLLWLARRHHAQTGRQGWLQAPGRLLGMQVFLLFGLLPLTALLFQRVPLVATPVNLIAVPLFSFIVVPLTLAALALLPVSGALAETLLHAVAICIDAFDVFIDLMLALPFADLTLAEISGIAWLYVLVPLAWVVLPPGWPGRHVAVLGVIAILAWRPPAPPEGCFDAWILDVRQGLAVVVQTHEGVMLFDTGMAWRGGGSVASQSILPFLRSRGLERVDWLVISHNDLDHSGGLDALRAEIGTGTVLAGDTATVGADRRCVAGMSWSAHGVRFDVLYPAAGDPETGNDASCVIRVSAGRYALLLTGDIEAAAERVLLQRGTNLASNIVIVPHHGSLTSSSIPFTDSTHPEFAVVSAGFGNRWELPKRRVVERWQAQGAEVLNTALHGAVHFRVCARDGVHGPGIERRIRHRFWHAAT